MVALFITTTQLRGTLLFIISEPGNQAIGQPPLHQQTFLIVKPVELMSTPITDINFVLTFVIVMPDVTRLLSTMLAGIRLRSVLRLMPLTAAFSALDPALIVVFIVQIVVPILVGNVRNVPLSCVVVMNKTETVRSRVYSQAGQGEKDL